MTLGSDSLFMRFADWLQIRRWNFWHLLRLPSLIDVRTLNNNLISHKEQCDEIRLQLCDKLYALSKSINSLDQANKLIADKVFVRLNAIDQQLSAIFELQEQSRLEFLEKSREYLELSRKAQTALIEKLKTIDTMLTSQEKHANEISDLQKALLFKTKEELIAYNSELDKKSSQSFEAGISLVLKQNDESNKIIADVFQKSIDEIAENLYQIQLQLTADNKSIQANLNELSPNLRNFFISSLNKRQNDLDSAVYRIVHAAEKQEHNNDLHHELLTNIDETFCNDVNATRKKIESEMSNLLSSMLAAKQVLETQALSNSTQIVDIDLQCKQVVNALQVLIMNSIIDKIDSVPFQNK